MVGPEMKPGYPAVIGSAMTAGLNVVHIIFDNYPEMPLNCPAKSEGNISNNHS